MDVYLTECFFRSLSERPRRKHVHLGFELVCIEDNGKMRFVINPPLYEHYTADAPPENVCSMLFSFGNSDAKSVCTVLKNITKETYFEDTFDGISRIRSIKSLVRDDFMGAREQIKAEIQLLFISMARALFPQRNVAIDNEQTLDSERMARIEEFFNVYISDSSCSKLKLASELGVCERQLTRILKEIYGKTFSELMLDSRMSIADAMRDEGEKTVEQVATAVGYISVESFRRAYKNYFGKSYKSK